MTTELPTYQFKKNVTKGSKPCKKYSNCRKCPKCGKILKSSNGLKIHLEHHKDRSEWKWQCRLCFKKFSTKESLYAHQRSHTKERPYKCIFCTADFGYRTNLTKHLKTVHKKEKGVEEEIKRKWFLKSTHRAELLKSHANIQPNVKVQCTVQQQQKYNMRKKRAKLYSNYSEIESSDDSQDFTEDKSADESMVEFGTFPDNDIQTEYDDMMPELDDYSGDIINDAVDETYSTYENEYTDKSNLEAM